MTLAPVIPNNLTTKNARRRATARTLLDHRLSLLADRRRAEQAMAAAPRPGEPWVRVRITPTNGEPVVTYEESPDGLTWKPIGGPGETLWQRIRRWMGA